MLLTDCSDDDADTLRMGLRLWDWDIHCAAASCFQQPDEDMCLHLMHRCSVPAERMFHESSSPAHGFVCCHHIVVTSFGSAAWSGVDTETEWVRGKK